MQKLDQQTAATIVLSLLRKTAERSIIWTPSFEQRMIDACKNEINAGESLGYYIYVACVGNQYLRVFCYTNSSGQTKQEGSRAVARDGYIYQLDIYNPSTLGPYNSINNSSALYDLYNCILNSDNSLNMLLNELGESKL